VNITFQLINCLIPVFKHFLTKSFSYTKVEDKKRRTRRTAKHNRAIQGASWSEILAKRNQKPEVRKAQREQAIKMAKDKKRTADQAKKALKKSAPKAKTINKNQRAGGRVGVSVRR